MTTQNKDKKKHTVDDLKKANHKYFYFVEEHILDPRVVSISLLLTKPGPEITTVPDNYFDYAFVFPVREKKNKSKADVSKLTDEEIFNFIESHQTNSTRFCLSRLLYVGFEVKVRLSLQKDEMFVLFRAPDNILRKFADDFELRVLADEYKIKECLHNGNLDKNIKPVFINESNEGSRLSPYEQIYLKYSEDHTDLYALHELENYTSFEKHELKPLNTDLENFPFSPRSKEYNKEKLSEFSAVDRLKLTDMIIKAHSSEGGCQIDFIRMHSTKSLLAYYPLHNDTIRSKILDAAFKKSVMPWQLPINDIRNYFGEKMALYSVFLGHLTFYFFVPAIVGLGFQFLVLGTQDFDHKVLPFFSLFIPLWSMFTNEMWKRTESRTALAWGMTEYENLEQTRYNFKGDIARSYIDGKEELFFPVSKTAKIQNASALAVSVFVAFIVGIVAAIYYFRSTLDDAYASIVASILNTIQISIFNILYSKFAVWRTEAENHRTETEFEDSLIIKTFAFQFINSYSSFFYLAFIASEIPDDNGVGRGSCGASSCMVPLSINLAIIFGTRLVVTNTMEILLPYYSHVCKIFEETEGTPIRLTFFNGWWTRNENNAGSYAESSKWIDLNQLYSAERNYFLLPFENTIPSIQRYIDTAIQYGFAVLFVTALPAAPALAIINNYAKVKFDLWKLISFYQRPVPVGAQDIGTWQLVFNIISILCIFTNGAMVFFTMNLLRVDYKYSLVTRIWFFLGFQWILLGLQVVAQIFIVDEPSSVTTQKERMKFIESKAVDCVPDNDFNFEYEKDKCQALQNLDKSWKDYDSLQEYVSKYENSNKDLPNYIPFGELSLDEQRYRVSLAYDELNFDKYFKAYGKDLNRANLVSVKKFFCFLFPYYVDEIKFGDLEKEDRKINTIINDFLDDSQKEEHSKKFIINRKEKK